MSDLQDEMISVLSETVIPELRKIKFTGSFPHFRRIQEDKICLLSFQFNFRSSFLVELAVCGVDGITAIPDHKIPPNKVTPFHISPVDTLHRVRLGARTIGIGNGIWFKFKPTKPGIHQAIVEKLLSLIHSEAEDFWKTQPVN